MKRGAARWSFFAATLVSALVVIGCGSGGAASSYSPPSSFPPPPPGLTIMNQWPQSLPTAVLGQPYSTKLQATGGTPPYTWTAPGLGIPGMTLATDGTLSGTPQLQATFIPNVTVTDSRGASATAMVELNVIAPLSFSTAPALPDQNMAFPVSVGINATGGVQPYTFSLAPGSVLPNGLGFTSVNGAGIIQGTATTPGNYSFTVQATDSFTPPFKISQTFTLKITNDLVLPQAGLPDAVQNLFYSENIKPAGGTPPYKIVLAQNSVMPSGLLLDTATGKVYGTPTTTTVPFFQWVNVVITDSASPPATITGSLQLTVQPPLSLQIGNLPDSARGLNYGGYVSIVGGRSPYTTQVTGGAIPDGLIISTPNLYGGSYQLDLTGVPTTDGLFKFTVKVSDSYETPNTVTQDFQIRISDPMAITGPTLVQILYNQSYSTNFPATGGFPPYTWSVDRALPPGFTFDPATGALSGIGTVNTGSQTSPNVTVHDSSTPPLTATYYGFTLQIFAKLGIATTSLPTVATGSSVWLQPSGIGGTEPYQWSVSAGSLPPGVSVTIPSTYAGSMITGSPTAPGTYNFTLTVSDNNTGSLHQTASQQLTLTVKDRAQMTRNDTIAQATPLSNIHLLASISPYSDPSTAGPDVDVYSATAAPGSVVEVYVDPNNDFLQPPEPNSLQPIVEIVDSTGARYQNCAPPSTPVNATYNLPCINNLPNLPGSGYIQGAGYGFQVPGTGTAPVPFFIRVSDERGDARPDFIYTFSVYGVN